ncbi:MAG: carnitine 3-dehydrogenase [Solirubrobacterales bacterium]|nr:carnitine 3-dehydrogenase [Solirubrobacterales bacterium]
MSELPARVGLLGGGVIGGGWAARFALNGIDVRVYDPDPDASRKLDRILQNARLAYDKLTALPLPPEGTVSFADSVSDAVCGAELVQESAPERVELKQRLLAEASAAAGPDVLICSSTSGLRPSLLALEMERPERFVVAHPFNPVYLLPLVELCAGTATAAATVDRAAAVYRAIGMHPLALRHEIDGFIADRLLEALWREALWLVHDDVATVAEVDDAIRYGAGLRWAIMGTFLTYRLAGGEDGMRAFMKQFGPALALPWTKLVDVPELTPAFLDEVANQSDAQADGQTVAELERQRDDCLVAILQALRARETGAGATLADWERDLLSRSPVPLGAGRSPSPSPSQDGASPEPLTLLAREVPPGWLDYNGHVTESRYLQLFGEATDALLRHIGVDAAYLGAGGSYYTVETHISHLGQLFAGDRVQVATQVLGWDDRRLHLFHVLVRAGEQDPVATGEHMLLHVDAEAGRAAPVRDGVRERLAALADAQAALARPPRAGRRIAL